MSMVNVRRTFRDRVYLTRPDAENDLPNYHYSRPHYVWEVTIPGGDTRWVIEAEEFWAINNAAKVMGFEAVDLGNDRYRVTWPGGNEDVTVPCSDSVKKFAKPIVQVAESRGYRATLVCSATKQSPPPPPPIPPEKVAGAPPVVPVVAGTTGTSKLTDKLAGVKLLLEVLAVLVGLIGAILALLGWSRR